MGIFIAALLSITVGLVVLVALIQRKAAPEMEPYHPLFAEAPDPDPVARHYEETGIAFDPQRTVPFIASDHPSDCGDACCWEIRLDELHDSFDWHAAEHEMRSKR